MKDTRHTVETQAGPIEAEMPNGSGSFVSGLSLGSYLTNKCHVVEGQAREGRILTRKRRSESMAHRIQTFDPVRGGRMRACGWKRQEWVKTCCGSSRSVFTFRCYDPLCPTCRNIRGAKLAATLGEALTAYQKSNGLYSYFLTLTFKNTDRLRDYSSMTRAVKRLLRMNVWKDAGLFGTVRSFENKIGSGSGQWHSHFHIVVMTQRPIDTESGSIQDLLRARWEKITGDSFKLDLRPFDGQYREVFKYVSKDAESMTDEQLREFAAWMRGRRFLALTGKLYDNEDLRALVAEADEDEPDTVGCCPNCGGHGQTEVRLSKWDGNVWVPWATVSPPAEGMTPKQLDRYAREHPALCSLAE